MGFFSSSKPGYKQISTLSPQQQPVLNNLTGAAGNAFGTAGNYYNDLLSNNSQDVDAFQAPELRRFNEQTIPGIAEQFAGMGSGGLSSSGFQNAAVNAGADLGERLGAMRAQLRQSAAQGLTGIGQQALGNYNENVYEQPQGGFLSGIAPLLGSAIGSFGGGAGTALGNGIGNWISQKGQSSPLSIKC